MFFEQGLAGVAVNRRRVGHREYPGPVEQDVPVLAVRDQDGTLRAGVFGYACHNTVLDDYRISGDWAGYAHAAIEKRYPSAVAMFVQDCGVDANPLPRRSVELAEYGETIAAAGSPLHVSLSKNGFGGRPKEFRVRAGISLSTASHS